MAVLFISPSAFAEDAAPAPTPTSSTERRFHVSLSPLPLLAGAIAGNVDIKLNERWTLGPSFLYWNAKILDLRINASGLGVRTAYSFRNPALQDGPYLAGILSYGSSKITQTSTTYGELSGEASGAGITGLAGYHWILPAGLSFRAGVGLGLSKLNKVELKDSSGTVREDGPKGVGGIFATELDIGWTF